MKIQEYVEVVLAICLVLFVIQFVGYSLGMYSLEALIYVLSMAFAIYSVYFLWKVVNLERAMKKGKRR